MIVSVILPTIRPQLICAILAGWETPLCLVPPSEIIVVADFSMESVGIPPREGLRWFVRARQGVIDAINLGYGVAQGEYLFVTNDETTPEPDCLLQLYQAAKWIPDRLLTPNHQPPFPFQYYHKRFAPFPFASRALFERLGGLFDPAFHAFYADPDLSMRAHAAGVPVDEVPTAVIHHHNAQPKNEQWDRWFLEDRATFRGRWDHLGAFRDP